ncbi:MAG: phosphoribosylaminoimidazole-succinocarboxamide synthase [uncultured bacterium]|uniref:Phosphoribosylaminoimidazole-succinocarboxamide synthase n=3 Tax=Candidatus Daviesiibacteriota TaxID=1752718 RepID=A0A0G0EY59_9BACT|nr:MAG: phosphoribosylaminoimidazole-succinocarboxamide synthase [uncultured bacterium]KKQ10457.1 MAG: Phosphoribosylaminoimidazole-succinocarboxamide synthase [Candidatus Daviesbacteria bacterium GW2011_GWB1_36_5]KKQ16189.1 MAG: Phosphoribosylaminoimidazole-succinocarboxamide synthase [Candidatus Daviesbacteria bacterium GW2011_GWA1_36_8]OGE33263.1 MAG: phosphoribosylaminoimidazolesuccinocarboxamide synthase [Candidatus Daviesbacteria bacterium RIFCSPHIGHO2_02_FULL_37_9]OGE36165.1 MAG: phospho
MVSKNKILKAIPNILKTVNIPNLGEKHQGKVRDYYVLADEQSSRLRTKRIIITTDRQSAFDRVLGHIPYKGAVLNLLSAFWFDKTKDIIDNHWVCNLYYNVIVVKNCQIIPIEMVVRGYITGVTDTSIWGSYEKGERVIYGIKFPDGLKKNQKLPSPVITPTTKAESGHDERLTEKEILEKKIVSKKLWTQMKKAAVELFERGSKICDRAGIILADTKYEFGLFNGKLMLIDEVHTPDSSRFWVKKSYKDRLKKGLEPESYDKEILRIWFKEKGYSGEGKPPKMPDDFLVKMSQRYIGIYEKITGKKFKTFDYPIEKRIRDSLKKIG